MEPLEDAREIGGVDAVARVRHDQLGLVAGATQRHVDAAAPRRVLHGVRDQVRQHLLQAHAVADDERGARVDRGLREHFAPVQVLPRRFDHVLHHAAEIHELALHVQLAGHDA